ncbi:LytR/AlgR family response regulator transcription factor [Agaribacter marinus]|uniref:DNA-binding response regulator n=1 Tax=Agaribacter marinus TaxID=1431249 RepID=A0AA37SVR9_9ALTE|nr:LytTR family transcriptional regulator DNA-binding domain-containing protein [Agaribacter marinus]GLR70423.1 DNA-binding response regulator [Agaribacter marinus]
MKAIVIEDSALAREGLIELLSEFPSVELVGDAADAKNGLTIIEAEKPDVLFLDIHLPGDSGFDLLSQLSSEPKIIFTTAYSEYAIQSFDFDTIDYLLKPISKERLTVAVNKALKAIEKQKNEELARKTDKLAEDHRLFVKDGDDCFLVALSDIRYIESCKNHVRLFFNQDKAFLRKSMSTIEARLPERLFFRANRQFIINLKHIINIEEWVNDGFRVTLSDGAEIDISRRHATRLKESLSL